MPADIPSKNVDPSEKFNKMSVYRTHGSVNRIVVAALCLASLAVNCGNKNKQEGNINERRGNSTITPPPPLKIECPPCYYKKDTPSKKHKNIEPDKKKPAKSISGQSGTGEKEDRSL